MPGGFELVIILVIVVILFGVGKLPKVLGQVGKGVKAFKEGVQGNEITGLDDDEAAVDVTPEETPKAIYEKPDQPVEQAEEIVAATVPEEEEDNDSA
jgi:sec-independent protein translocase protein TatA